MRRALPALLVLAACTTPQAPFAPISPIAFNGRDPGAIDINLDGTGSSQLYGGGQVSVEPYFHWEASAPVSVAVQTNGRETHVVARAGARYRIGKPDRQNRGLIGGGIGPTWMRGEDGIEDWAPTLDIEGGWGKTTRKRRQMVVLRPSLTVVHDRLGLGVPIAFSYGYRLGRRITLSFSPFTAVRVVFDRPGRPALPFGPAPGSGRWSIEGGVMLSLSGHVPRKRYRDKPRVLFEL